MLISINIQPLDGEKYKIFIFPYSFEVSASSFSQVWILDSRLPRIRVDKDIHYSRVFLLAPSTVHFFHNPNFQFLFTTQISLVLTIPIPKITQQ